MLALSLSALLLRDGCSEIGILVCHPIDEFAYIWVGEQAFHIHAMALQFGIGEIRDQRLLTNGVHGDYFPSAPAFRHGVVPYDCRAGGATAEPARHRSRC